LLGEHRELHALWTVISQHKKGYSLHPETIRWKGKLHALYVRHEMLVSEMGNRGYNHKTPLNKEFAVGRSIQDEFVHTVAEQKEILKNKDCECRIDVTE
jgi:hypothetical protein